MVRNDLQAKRSGNPIDQHVGARLRLRRMMVNMSQTALGERLGVTFQQIQKYEKGTNRIGASRLQMIAEVLDVSVTYFFEGATKSSPASKGEEEAALITNFAGTADGLTLIRAFSSIADKEVRSTIVRLVGLIAASEGNKSNK